MRRFVLCLTLCYFVLVLFSPFSVAITSLGEERANLSAFRAFVRFSPVWFCLVPLPLGVWVGLRFVIVALPGLFFYFFFQYPLTPAVMKIIDKRNNHCSNEHTQKNENSWGRGLIYFTDIKP